VLKDILQITTAGSVDDGKSTLIARLLLDTGSIPTDQITGTFASDLDPTRIADLLDGLESEKEQGITIDVAHRFFDSDRRRYHLSDSPGHEQYTRNMATAAAGADAVVLVLDASEGVKAQTKKHLEIAYSLGVRKFIVVANKFDLVKYSQKVYASLISEVQSLFSGYPKADWELIPASGTEGAGVVRRGNRLKWFKGPTLLEALDSCQTTLRSDGDAVISVQLVVRLGDRKRRYLGSVIQGSIGVGNRMTIFPGQVSATIKVLQIGGVDTRKAPAGSEISFEIEEERDIERGSVLALADCVTTSHHWEAELIWLDSSDGFVGRPYVAKLGYQSGRVEISRAFIPAPSGAKMGETQILRSNGTYRVSLGAQRDFAISTFSELPALGRFILMNPETGQTSAVGTVKFSLRRSENIVPFDFQLDRSLREKLTGGAGKVIWLTGLSGSGKSTIADAVSKKLTDLGRIAVVLDGDSLRMGLNKDLGFSEADRVENIRRVAEVARILADAGIIALVSTISPYREDRKNAQAIIRADRFHEVFVSTPIEVCEGRDPKGLYQKARAGEIPNFTGVSAPYEVPDSPALEISGNGKLDQAVEAVTQLVLG
jgi:bifunctional enzyme CysN/CysC